ncbi:NB-ARC domain-containing protein [Planktothrix agardhii 1029]|jgi:DNA-directed RNA polymerase specialized sigma24 family protein|uniref:ATP-binding protein n=1 Tax=Planktothrix agardhii TaxID=1160 RepID=UPI00048433F2|nr:ATP-binding protein [Planktothrix agardhii]MCB8764523.1 AAA family ATPase [Planktothrix agardhii 1809]MCB8766205.1 AAA family ATPase [Planktothrix agardhii 1809]MCB8778180.1 AAA family ATPase [Planktothrix agardhii 1031]MCB8782581.1 AAA family ATPase [Planktothrix agardhii 1808]MCF3566389.1 NB-ARC domain-containing protein [Planktothrix agardhii 1807]
MTMTEILQFADQLIFAKKGKHLDDLQESIIKGVWDGQSYQEIADECNRSESRVRNIAAKLLQLLSEELGEDIEKTNFRSTLERVYIKSSQVIGLGNHHSFHFCTQTLNQSNTNNRENDINITSKLSHHDLNLTPQIINFYNRKSELKTLSSWILDNNIRLISVLGLSGIGKTTLVKRFVDLNLDKFEVIIWKSLKYPKPLELLMNDLLNACKQELKATIDDNLKQLFNVFTDKKCLIILDDVHNIFTRGEFSGQYQSVCQDYQNFFKLITETEHQSHLILMSQEQCAEMECLDEELYPIKSLKLSGLEDGEILSGIGLKQDQDSGLKLIEKYQGNPMYLKDIALLIKDVFDGDVAEFLAEDSLVITKEMRSHFNQLFNRLSPIEQEIVLVLSQFEQPVSREDLRQHLDLSSMDLINGLKSLQQRYLVAKIKGDTILFNLSCLFREYVRTIGEKSNNY